VFLRFYLIAYFALIGAAALALWEGGVLERLPVIWVAVVLAGAGLLGILWRWFRPISS
jgi:hypothetical protein